MIKAHHKFMWSFSRSFIRALKRPVFIYLVTLAITMQIFFAGVFFFTETGANSAISSYFDVITMAFMCTIPWLITFSNLLPGRPNISDHVLYVAYMRWQRTHGASGMVENSLRYFQSTNLI